MAIRPIIVIAAAALLAASPGAAVDLTQAPYGRTKAGEAVDQFTLTNRRGMTVRILSLGGIITEISVPDRRGVAGNIVLALPDLAAYEARPNFSSIIGRYANRISGGGFTLNGVRHDLVGSPAGVSSHGGPGGFGARVWRAEPVRQGQDAGIRLRYLSGDGENGFPGNLSVDVTYTLNDANALRIVYRATTDKPTVINLTNHAYFNLAGGTSGRIDDQTIQVVADRYTPLDKAQLPTGAIAPVDGTPFDLRSPTRFGDRIASTHPQMLLAKGYDHNFVLAKRPGAPLQLAARAHDPRTGRTLDVLTTEPGLQLYTANGFNGTLIGTGGRTLRQSDGYALETQHFADSPNRPEFPSTMLSPGTRWESTTELRFTIK